MTLKFSDGVTIDTNGELRTLRLDDGWYVIGDGMLLPCSDREDAEEELAILRQARLKRGVSNFT